MTFNASERKDVRQAEKAARQAALQRAEIIRGILSLAPGRAWMCDLLERCHIFSSSFSTSALATAFAEGERNIGLQLLGDIHAHCPEQYTQMMRERNDRDTSRSAIGERARSPNADWGDSEPSGSPSPDDDAWHSDDYASGAH